MSAKPTREHIVEVADMLFYRQGYEYTSFSDIADSVKISRGNFYHHFKTKDEILDAVIKFRLKSTQKMLEMWESEGKTPQDRIKSFIYILVTNWDKIRHYGCPVGTLCSELSKLNHASKSQAGEIFNLFRVWLRRQFASLGHNKEADKLAMHLLARSQGVATLANAMGDENFLKREVAEMCDWLEKYVKQGK